MYAGSHWMYVAHHSISMQEPTIYINVSTGSQPWIGCTGYTRHIGRELQLHTSTISYRVLAKLKYRKRTNKSWRIKALHEQNIVQTEKIYNKMIFNISRFYVSKLFIRQTNGGHRMTLVLIFFFPFSMHSYVKIVKHFTMGFYFFIQKEYGEMQVLRIHFEIYMQHIEWNMTTHCSSYHKNRQENFKMLVWEN